MEIKKDIKRLVDHLTDDQAKIIHDLLKQIVKDEDIELFRKFINTASREKLILFRNRIREQNDPVFSELIDFINNLIREMSMRQK